MYFHKLMISVLRIPSRVNSNKPLKTMNRMEINKLFSAILLFHISVIVMLPCTSNVNFFIINSPGKLPWVVIICHLHLTDTLRTEGDVRKFFESQSCLYLRLTMRPPSSFLTVNNAVLIICPHM